MFTFYAYSKDDGSLKFRIKIKREEIVSYFLDFCERGFNCYIKPIQ